MKLLLLLDRKNILFRLINWLHKNLSIKLVDVPESNDDIFPRSSLLKSVDEKLGVSDKTSLANRRDGDGYGRDN